jgi:hypothetical protein
MSRLAELLNRCEITDAEGRMDTYLTGEGRLLIPPTADIEKAPDPSGRAELTIKYEVPASVREPGRVSAGERVNEELVRRIHDLLESKRGYVLPFYQYPRDPFSDFQELGWNYQFVPTNARDANRLLQSFMKLADGQPEQVRDFVLEWGPLWYCHTHELCHWSPLAPAWPGVACRWWPAEPIGLFRKLAGEVRATYRIAAALQKGDPANSEDWDSLFDGSLNQRPVEWQCRFMAVIISNFLATLGPTIQLDWNQSETKLVVNSGFGFYRWIWMHLGQLLSEHRMLCICSGCGEIYIRDRRTSRPRNYCQKCGKKAAKRDHARRMRAQAKLANGSSRKV